jgi:hypothetical protein
MAFRRGEADSLEAEVGAIIEAEFMGLVTKFLKGKR